MNSSSWVVHKFGGTSVGDANAMRKCVDIIRPLCLQQNNRIAVVVSAMGGKPKITDLLLDLVHDAANLRLQDMENKINLIVKKHLDVVSTLFQSNSEIANKLMNLIYSDLKDINDLLRAVQLMRIPHEQILELVSGYGEIWSANIMTVLMKQS